jgi:hypothetical protein
MEVYIMKQCRYLVSALLGCTIQLLSMDVMNIGNTYRYRHPHRCNEHRQNKYVNPEVDSVSSNPGYHFDQTTNEHSLYSAPRYTPLWPEIDTVEEKLEWQFPNTLPIYFSSPSFKKALTKRCHDENLLLIKFWISENEGWAFDPVAQQFWQRIKL